MESRTHYDQALALYDPAGRLLATRFGQDVGVAILSYRSLTQWMLGYREAALADAERAVKDGCENGQAATLMYALLHASWTHILNGTYAAAQPLLDELAALADEKDALFWKSSEMCFRGVLFALSGKTSEAIPLTISGIDAMRSVHATLAHPWVLSCLAKAHAALGQFDDAWRCIRVRPSLPLPLLHRATVEGSHRSFQDRTPAAV
jgi:tetratricopeptide (TPR) repeat protein